MKVLFQILFLYSVQIGFGQITKLDIRVDERMELITTVQYLSDYFLLTKAEINYKEDIDRFFEKVRNHPVIELNKKIQNDFFYASSVSWYLYQFSFPDFRPISKFTKEDNQIEDYEKHIDTLELFKKELKDFYIKSNFHTFFTQHKKFYNSFTLPVKKYINQFDIINILEDHYGEKKRKYILVLSPLMHDGGFGAEVHTKMGQEIYAFIGPKYNSIKTPNFDTKNILQEYVLHEFSHSFCNQIINKNYVVFEKNSCLEDTISKEMSNQGYGDDWQTCLYEHLVRANEIVLTKKIFGKAESDKLYDEYFNKRSWIYLKGLVSIIEDKYLKDRKQFKTQYDITPNFIVYFDEQKEKNCR